MSLPREEPPGEPIRVVRVISRLNIGGPAIQAIALTKRLEDHGYRTTLVRGSEEPDEGNMNYLADELGVRPVLVPSLRRNPGWHDLAALLALIRIMRCERPHIVHTHAAKGGTLGRTAALIAGVGRRPRPVLVHSFHGHSLSGYFSSGMASLYRRIEMVLGCFTDRLIAVSEEVRDELVALGVAPAAKFDVVRLGFDLSPFTSDKAARSSMREALRAELGIDSHARVVTLVARLVPIKRVDRFLRVALALRDLDRIRFLIVGDGELRDELKASAEAQALDDQLVWAGFRRDMPAVFSASDLVMLTSDSEGTPVSLIEAQAAGVPVVGTRVGGMSSVVRDGSTGFVVDPSDEGGIAAAVSRALEDATLAERAVAGEAELARRFSLGSLVDRIDELYKRTLAL